ncbi:MAG: (d)CMP kinase [Fusobacteria bacterium]|nr:(d)CMP kinase [Fusobacteriota bacterium]
MDKVVIAIDGPAGSGKSTIAKIISKKLNFTYIDTGAMYRMVTLYFIENKISKDEENHVLAALDNIKIDMKDDKFYLNNVDVSEKIRDVAVTNNVSSIAAINVVRENMVVLQRDISIGKDVILDGRDVGTVIFPNAKYKFYLDADINIRAKRRYSEMLNKNIDINYEDVLLDMIKRDKNDTERENSPLRKAEDAIIISTDNKTIEEISNYIINTIKRGCK